jgi:5'-nucleotidase
VLAAGVDPDVVVSGSNQGQNIGNLAEVSGTVGAGRTANRLGLPAIAVSNGLGAGINYTQGANLAAYFVEALRQYYADGTAGATTININVPTCPTGSPRGNRIVPLGRGSEVSGYTVQSGSVGNGTFQPTIVNQNPIATPNCTGTPPATVTNDIQAFVNGFVTITWLMPDLTAPGQTPAAASQLAAVQKRVAAVVK